MQRRPLVIVPADRKISGQHAYHMAGEKYLSALSQGSAVMPLILPSLTPALPLVEVLQNADGLFLTGSYSNIEPHHYSDEPSYEGNLHDPHRDANSLPIIQLAIEMQIPVLAVCRGFQEVNVAMGGTLYPEIRDLPGRMNHRMPPDGTLEEKFALRHPVRFTPGGPFADLFGCEEVMTNTLHGQGIKCAGCRVVIDGKALDGTPEAIYVQDAPGFTLSVQWHPEWNAANDPVSRPLFRAFGLAIAAWAQASKSPARLIA